MAQGFVLTPSLANLIAELVRRLRAPTMDLYSPVMRSVLASQQFNGGISSPSCAAEVRQPSLPAIETESSKTNWKRCCYAPNVASPELVCPA